MLPQMQLEMLLKVDVLNNKTSASASMEVSTLPSVVLLEVSDGTKNNKIFSSVFFLPSLAASWVVPDNSRT